MASAAPLATQSVRCIGIAALFALFALHASVSVPGSIAVGGAILAIGWDRGHALSLRNVLLIYTVGLFAFGSALIDVSPRPYKDMVIYVAAVLTGYTLSSLRRRERGWNIRAARKTFRIGADRIYMLETTIVLLIGLNLAILFYNLIQYGVGAFYSGQALLDQLSTYGKASVSGGVLQIAIFFIKYTGVAAVVLYVCTCLENRAKIRYRYPLALLVVVPILLLGRSDALTGAAFLLVVHAIDRRITAQRGAAGAAERQNRTQRVQRRSNQAIAIAIALAVAFTAAVLIGGLRQESSPAAAQASTLERHAPLLKSELTPIQAYSEIRKNEDVLGHPHGSTIVWPLVLKVVPRALFPAKPENSGAYYLSRIRPNEFAAGYALPPTFYGDAFLSFGLQGAALLSLLLGGIVARLDVAYKKASFARLPAFLVVYANFYGLLRNALSESLAAIVLTALALAVLRRLFGSNVAASDTRRGGQPVAVAG